MAARIQPKLTEAWRQKIKTSMLTNRLMQHANGEVEMTSTQIKAAEILLKKTIPDLARSEITGKDGAPLEVKFTTVYEKS